MIKYNVDLNNTYTYFIVEHPEIPQRTGKLNQVNKFDAAFFGVHYKQAHTMDPMCRIILEKSYEAIVDSGTFNKLNIILYGRISIGISNKP